MSSGSVTASTDPAYGFRVNANSQFSGSTQITGSLGVTGSVSISGSVGSVFTTNIDTMILTGSFLQSGSTFITGTLGVFGGITGSLFGTSSWAVSSSLAQTASLAILAPAYTTTASFNQFSSSYYIDSASFSSSIALLSGSFLRTSSSYASASGSLSTRVTNLESTASILTTASASFSIVSASYASASGSLSTRVTTLENASASFAQDSGSTHADSGVLTAWSRRCCLSRSSTRTHLQKIWCLLQTSKLLPVLIRVSAAIDASFALPRLAPLTTS